MNFQSPSVRPEGQPAIAGDILMVLGHHLILDITRLEKLMIGFIRLHTSICSAGRPAIAGDILMVLGHHLILDMARPYKLMKGFIQLRAPAISRKGKVRELVKSKNLSSFRYKM